MIKSEAWGIVIVVDVKNVCWWWKMLTVGSILQRWMVWRPKKIKKKKMENQLCIPGWERPVTVNHFNSSEPQRGSQNAILSVTCIHTCVYLHPEVLFVPASWWMHQFIMLVEYYWKSVRNSMVLQNILLVRS